MILRGAPVVTPESGIIAPQEEIVKARISLIFVVLVSLAVSGNTQTGQPQVMRDLEYSRAGDTSLKLDLYLPAVKGPHPLVVWIHGGAFLGGDKGQVFWTPILDETKRGYAVASINYRLSNQAVFPALIQDCRAAIRWLRANAAKYDINAERIVVGGESAGGYLAAFLGTSGDVTTFDTFPLANSKQSSRVQGVVDFFGPTDFLQMDAGAPRSCEKPQVHNVADSPESRLMGCNIQECPDKVKAANPISYVTKDDPPFLILHGTSDCLVAPNQSQLLYDALNAAGVRASLHLLPGFSHGDKRFISSEYEKLVNEFIDSILR